MFFGGQDAEISSDGERFVITDMNLNDPTSSSILRVVENTPGTYQYVCTAVLQFPGEQDDVMTSSSANVTVQGRAVHTHDVSIVRCVRNCTFSFSTQTEDVNIECESYK